MKKTLLIILGIVVVLLVALAGYYNSFIRIGEDVNAAWSQVENQYQRRADLIPNLVETVKGYAKQEQTVFTAVTEARSKVAQMVVTPETLKDPEAFAKFQEAQDSLSGALSRLMAVSENYPQLKSNENFLALQNQLEGTENRISVERGRYNEIAKEYNKKSKGVPGVWFVSMFNLDKTKQLFKAVAGADQAVQVKF